MAIDHHAIIPLFLWVPIVMSVFGVHMWISVSGWERANEASFAEGKSLPFPLKHFHSAKALPSLPDSNSKLTRLSDLVIVKLQPARLLT